MSKPIADWQLPPGVDRGLWEYVHDGHLVSRYDDGLKDCGLVKIDQQFVEKNCTRSGPVIDLGCGTGRTLLPFAQRGHWTLGVDLSEDMLRAVTTKAIQANVEIHCLKANLVELGGIRDNTFANAVCMFSTLGMIVGEANRRQMLQHVHRILQPGGRFVLHVHNRWFHLWTAKGRSWLWQYFRHGDSPMPAHDRRAGFTLHLFTRREICELLRQVGFRILQVQPISEREDGEISRPMLMSSLRAYGFLIAVEKLGG